MCQFIFRHTYILGRSEGSLYNFVNNENNDLEKRLKTQIIRIRKTVYRKEFDTVCFARCCADVSLACFLCFTIRNICVLTMQYLWIIAVHWSVYCCKLEIQKFREGELFAFHFWSIHLKMLDSYAQIFPLKRARERILKVNFEKTEKFDENFFHVFFTHIEPKWIYSWNLLGIYA